MNARPLLTIEDVATILRLPRSQVKRLAISGDLPTVHLSDRELRFLEADVVDWIARRRKGRNDDQPDAE